MKNSDLKLYTDYLLSTFGLNHKVSVKWGNSKPSEPKATMSP